MLPLRLSRKRKSCLSPTAHFQTVGLHRRRRRQEPNNYDAIISGLAIWLVFPRSRPVRSVPPTHTASDDVWTKLYPDTREELPTSVKRSRSSSSICSAPSPPRYLPSHDGLGTMTGQNLSMTGHNWKMHVPVKAKRLSFSCNIIKTSYHRRRRRRRWRRLEIVLVISLVVLLVAH